MNDRGEGLTLGGCVGTTPQHSATAATAARARIACRIVLHVCVFGVCLALLLRTFLLDTYHVPTGSMAPALLGDHRACACPRCGHPVEVGLHSRDPGEAVADPRYYR